MIYATFDSDGRSTGFYFAGIHGSNIPAAATEISDEDYQAYVQEQGKWVRDASTGQRIAYTAPVFLDSLKKDACNRIDTKAGEMRNTYVTTALAQDSTYIYKALQADAYKAANYPAVPDPSAHAFVIAEKEAMGESATYKQAADLIIATRDQWVIIGAKIEGVRRAAKIVIKSATTPEDIEAALQAGITELEKN